MANDPYWNSVVLAMHMDDASLSDMKGHPVTLAGGMTRSATQSKFGGYSAYFDGTDDYLALPEANFTFGTGDFTIDFFVYVDGSVNQRFLVDFRPANTNGAYPSLSMTTTNVLKFWHSATVRITGAKVIADGWHHVELSRASGVTKLFVDGAQDGSSYTDATTYGCGASRPRIGSGGYSTPESPFKGHIEDLRITKGVARHTANFTVPTEAFPNRLPQLHGTVKDQYGNFAARPIIAFSRNRVGTVFSTTSDATTGEFTLPVNEASEHVAIALPGEGDQHWSNVVLAMHMDDVGLTDAKGHAVTLIGNVARSSAQSKFGGYSAYFDGAGDFLYPVNSGPDFAFGTGDFTVEMWVYLPSLGVVRRALYDGRPTSNNGPYVFTYVSETNTIGFLVSSEERITGTTALAAMTWYHVALCRSGTSTKLFLNGVQEGATYSDGNNYLGAANRPFIGIDSYNSSASAMLGYVDDLRITKGVARYTANFTPPAAAFPHGLSIGAPTTNALIFDNITPV